MPSMEEVNIETVERWCRDVFGGDLDLLDDLFAYPYVLHSIKGFFVSQIVLKVFVIDLVASHNKWACRNRDHLGRRTLT